MAKLIPIIRNWLWVSAGVGGIIEGHPSFTDGDKIYTSRLIQATQVGDDDFLVQTKNGSRYQLLEGPKKRNNGIDHHREMVKFSLRPKPMEKPFRS